MESPALTASLAIAEYVASIRQEGRDVGVVVSAEAGATDKYLETAAQYGGQNVSGYLSDKLVSLGECQKATEIAMLCSSLP